MATKKTAATKTAAKKPAAPAKKAAPAAKKAAAAPVAKPLKDTFNKSSLLAHLVTQTELDKKTVQTVLAHLENTIVGAVNKKGAGEFTLPGLFKVSAIQVPATKKRFRKNPFTGQIFPPTGHTQLWPNRQFPITHPWKKGYFFDLNL